MTILAASRPPGAPTPDSEIPTGVGLRWFGPSRDGFLEYARRRWRSAGTGEPADVFRVEVASLMAHFEAEVRKRPDVIHLHGWGTAQLARLTRGVPSVHVAIDAWQAGYGTQFPVPRWRQVLEAGQLAKVRRHEARHYPACGAVVVVSDADAAVLRAAVPGARVEVVPNGVDLGPEPAPAASGAVLGFHGNLGSPANRDAALRLVTKILPAVRARRPDARAVLIGRDPPPELTRLAGPDIEVTGMVDDVRRALAPVAVYVAPMTTGTGIKNKVLEAMAAGLPVVGTPMAFHAIGSDAGIAAPDDDALAAAVLRLLDDKAERLRLGRAGRAQAGSFRWEDNAAAIEALWRAVLVDG